MEYIPVLYLGGGVDKPLFNARNLRDLMEKKGFSELYVVDVQGIKKNKPQYAFYQRFSPLFNLWVDTGPRDIGDVVDDIFSGAKRIIIRINIWEEDSLKSIREFSDHDVFIAVELPHIDKLVKYPDLVDDADGVVLFVTEKSVLDFKMESKLNQIIRNNNIYIFDDEGNERKWVFKDVKGFLKDIHHYM